MDLVLNKEFIENIDKSSEVEWLEKNNLGVYGASSCIGMNTRREHGIFVAPDYSRQKSVVLISKFEESVFIENRLYEISTNNYEGGIFPSGYNYIQSFAMKPFPRLLFEVENRIIEKTVFLVSEYPLMVVRYELKNQGLPINIIIKPFIADRYSTELTSEMQGLNTDSYQGQNFVRWALKPQLPEVYVYYNRGEFVAANLWYKNFHYPQDHARFEVSAEHLFNPGFFQATLLPYKSLTLYISTAELDFENLNYEALFRQEAKKRPLRRDDSESATLRIASTTKSATTQIHGQPVISTSTLENGCSTRDILFSMPGLYLAQQKHDTFKELFDTLAEQLQEGLLPVYSPLMRSNFHYCAADLSLWFIHMAYLYFEQSDDKEFVEKHYDTLKSVFEFYEKGTLFNIFCDKDGLIFSGSKNASTSWIPLKNGHNDVLRYGKLLEINLLWYNALKVLSHFAGVLGKKRWSTKFDRKCAKFEKSFAKTFKNANDGFKDFVNHNASGDDFRINQILLVCLPFTPLNQEETQAAMEEITAKLYTPYGLKSAVEKIADNADIKLITRKKPAYFSGAIWPWAMGLFAEAVYRRGRDDKNFAEKLKTFLDVSPRLLDYGILDYLPEAVSDEERSIQAGMRDFLPSSAMYLWSRYLYKKL